ncbi:MAG: ankyrin repeat domain-containing protein [Holophagales bacterium]|nr:ankyrin repeat domain-containing protein [Holophagales bacterium]
MSAPSLKAIAVAGWVFLALEAAAAARLLLTKNMGDDAAGRGLATAWGLLLAPAVLAAGGLLFWAQRSGSYPGVVAVTLVVGFPFLLMAGRVVMGPVHAVERVLKNVGRGRFEDPKLTAIATAIAKRDTSGATSLAARPGLDFTARDGKGRTILGIAVEAATDGTGNRLDVDVVRQLVKAGARYTDDAIQANGRMFSSVVYNVGDSNVELMDILLTAGANPDDTEEYDGRPLLMHHNMTAAKARVLLAHGARLDVRDDRSDRPGWDVLMNAVTMSEWELALLFLEKGVSPAFRATDGKGVRDILHELQDQATESGTSSQSQGPDALGPGYDRFLAALEAGETGPR